MFAIDGTFVLHYEMKSLIIGDFDAIYSLKWLRDVDSITCLAHRPQIIASSIKKAVVHDEMNLDKEKTNE